MRTRALLLVLTAAIAAPGIGSADEVPPTVTITLKDGGRLVGTIVREDGASVTLRTASGVELKLPTQAIAAREAVGAEASVATASPLGDPNASRLMFAPTGRPLGKGNGYLSDHYVVFPGFAYGLTRNLGVAFGMSTIPGLGLDQQLFYVSLSAGFKLKDQTALAVGGFVAASRPNLDLDLGAAALYGVSTFGPSERSLSLGLALVAVRNSEFYTGPDGELLGSRSSWRVRNAPALMVGGSLALAPPVSVVSESWLFFGEDFALSEQPFGLTLRFSSGRISADFGLVIVPYLLDAGCPLPWLSITYHFGPSRGVPSASPVPPAWARPLGRAR